MISMGALIIAVVIWFTVGVLVGAWRQTHWVHKEAIEKGHGHYDPQTGEFRWNDEVTK